MVKMKNLAGNVYKVVPFDHVDAMQSKGFIICEDRGGTPPPPTPLQDEKPIEPIQIVEVTEEPKKSGNLYWNQLNKTGLRELMDREGIKYTEHNTVPELRSIYKRYLDSLKRKRR